MRHYKFLRIIVPFYVECGSLLPLWKARPWSRPFVGVNYAYPPWWKQASTKQSESKLSHSKREKNPHSYRMIWNNNL